MTMTMDKTLEPHLLKVREAMIGEAVALAGPVLGVSKNTPDDGIQVAMHMSELRKLGVDVLQRPATTYETYVCHPTKDGWLVGGEYSEQILTSDEGAGRNLLLGRGERFELAHYSCPPENVRVALDLVFAYRSLPDPTFGIVAGK